MTGNAQIQAQPKRRMSWIDPGSPISQSTAEANGLGNVWQHILSLSHVSEIRWQPPVRIQCGPRCDHTCSEVRGMVYVFGGRTAGDPLDLQNDIWILSPGIWSSEALLA